MGSSVGCLTSNFVGSGVGCGCSNPGLPTTVTPVLSIVFVSVCSVDLVLRVFGVRVMGASTITSRLPASINRMGRDQESGLKHAQKMNNRDICNALGAT